MPYQNTTPTFQIPYMFQQERSSGVSNKRAALIIDSQMTAAVRFTGEYGVIAEGQYTGTFTAGNISQVRLLATNSNFALEGVINGVYIANNPTLTWDGLPDNTTSYLYAVTAETALYTSNEFSSLATKLCRVTSNTTGFTPGGAILLGTAFPSSLSGTVFLNTTSGVTDNTTWVGGKPAILPYADHRSKVPIDHPAGSVTELNLQATRMIRSLHIYVYDGLSSGTDSLSGFGISEPHLKSGSVSSRTFQTSVSISGLSIQQSFVSLPGSLVSFSGTELTFKSPEQITNQQEHITLQYLQNHFSGLQLTTVPSLINGISGLGLQSQSGLQILGSNQSGMQVVDINTQNRVTALEAVNIFNATQTQHGALGLVSGVGTFTVSFSPELNNNPTFLSSILHYGGAEIASSPIPIVKFLFSGNSGGFRGQLSGVTTDTLSTIYWEART